MFKASGLQRYIFSTNKLREVIGGSRLISHLTRDYLGEALSQIKCEEGRDLEVLQQTAGQATLRFFDEAKARALFAIWPLLVAQIAPDLEAHQWMGKVGDDGLFATLENGWDGLRALRNTRAPTLPEVTPVVIRSPRNGGAAVRQQATNYDTQYIDRASARKHAFLDHQGRRNLKKFAPGDVRKDWALNEWASINEDIAPKKGDYMSVVHADGNRLGGFLAAMAGSLKQRADFDDDKVARLYRDFSEGLAQTTRQAAIDAIASMAGLDDDFMGGALPVRPVVIGGDDVTLMIRSSDALNVTTHFLRRFETLSAGMLAELKDKYRLSVFDEDMGRAFSACAGVVYHTPAKPLLSAYESAEKLCDWAKKKSRAESGTTVSSVMFARTLDSTPTDFAARLEDDFQDEISTLYLSAGPYSANETQGYVSLKTLRDICGHADEISHSALRGVVDDLQVSGAQARRSFSRLVEIAGKSGDVFKLRIEGVGSQVLPRIMGLKSNRAPRNRAQMDVLDAGLSILPDASILQKVEGNERSSTLRIT